MNRHEFLAGLHERYSPGTYLEIGLSRGHGLRLSRARTIGVDPAFRLTSELACDLQLVRATSDDFFAREDATGWFPDGVIDLAFIDGLHVFEYALRDFMNTERHSRPTSVVVFDDMLPRSVGEASRDRHTLMWAGDVYKLIEVLERFRPDLVVVPVDTRGTGLLLVLGLDPDSTVLADHYDEIVAELATPDQQVLPDDVLHRTTAADPAQLLASDVWGRLAGARDAVADADADVTAVRALRGSADYTRVAPADHPWPKRKARPKRAPATGAERRAARPSKPATPPSFVRRVRNAIKRRL